MTAQPSRCNSSRRIGSGTSNGSSVSGRGNSAKIFKGYALTELSAAGLLYNAKAKEIYYNALGPLVKEPWLAKLDGPSSEGNEGGNADYVMLYTCKNHDCYDNNVVLLWSGIQNVCTARLIRREVDLDRQPTAGCRGRAREDMEEAVPLNRSSYFGIGGKPCSVDSCRTYLH